MDEIQPKKERKPRSKVVTLKKGAWIDGVLIGNTGAVLEVEMDVYNQLKKSKIIYE